MSGFYKVVSNYDEALAGIKADDDHDRWIWFHAEFPKA